MKQNGFNGVGIADAARLLDVRIHHVIDSIESHIFEADGDSVTLSVKHLEEWAGLLSRALEGKGTQDLGGVD